MSTDTIDWLLGLNLESLSPLGVFLALMFLIGWLWHKEKICDCRQYKEEKEDHSETKLMLKEAKEASKLCYEALDKEKERYIETKMSLVALQTQAQFGGMLKREESPHG